MITVDEEHDQSYKQDEGIIYNARDMAISRASFENIPINLVTAIPSVETFDNIKKGIIPNKKEAPGFITIKIVIINIGRININIDRPIILTIDWEINFKLNLTFVLFILWKINCVFNMKYNSWTTNPITKFVTTYINCKPLILVIVTE